jgi:hypothetical protein
MRERATRPDRTMQPTNGRAMDCTACTAENDPRTARLRERSSRLAVELIRTSIQQRASGGFA